MKRKLLLFLGISLSVCMLLLSQASPIYPQSSHILSVKTVDASNFPDISIYFTLYDSTGIPLQSLLPDEIELKENNQKVDNFSLEKINNTNIKNYIALLIDNSGSMKGKALSEAKKAAKSFIESLNEIDLVKIYVFNDSPEVLTDFTEDRQTLLSKIDSIEVQGTETALNLAVYNAAKDLQAKPQGQRSIVLFTDGKDEKASIEQDDAIEQAKLAKIPIYSVGFGDSFKKGSKKYDESSSKSLSRFSILTGGVFFIASAEGELASSLSKVSELLKFQYVIKYKSSLPKDAKEYNIELIANVAGESLMDSIPITTPTFEVKLSLDSIEEEAIVSDIIKITPDIFVTSPFSASEEIKLAKYYLDLETNLLYETDTYPFSFELDPKKFAYGTHTLIVKVYDSLDRSYEVSKKITFPAPPIYKNPLFYGPIAAAVLILAIVLPVVLTKKKRRAKVLPEYAYEEGLIDTTEQELLKPSDTLQEKLEEGFKEEAYDISGTILIDRDKLIPTSSGWLAAVKGSYLGKEYSLPDKRRITIGRETDNDIVIDDPAVSRHHCFIIADGKNYSLGDAGSANGTYLNDKKIQAQKKLSDGDIIGIGDTELEFKVVVLEKKEKAKKESQTAKSRKTKKKKKKG